MYANDRVPNECGANVPPSVDLENCSFERQGSLFQLCLKTVVTFLISYSFCSGVMSPIISLLCLMCFQWSLGVEQVSPIQCYGHVFISSYHIFWMKWHRRCCHGELQWKDCNTRRDGCTKKSTFLFCWNLILVLVELWNICLHRSRTLDVSPQL